MAKEYFGMRIIKTTFPTSQSSQIKNVFLNVLSFWLIWNIRVPRFRSVWLSQELCELTLNPKEHRLSNLGRVVSEMCHEKIVIAGTVIAIDCASQSILLSSSHLRTIAYRHMVYCHDNSNSVQKDTSHTFCQIHFEKGHCLQCKSCFIHSFIHSFREIETKMSDDLLITQQWEMVNLFYGFLVCCWIVSSNLQSPNFRF